MADTSPMPATAAITTSPKADGDVLIEWLRERDIPCPLCGYNLRQLTTARCPECGNDLRLAVALVEPLQKAWITLAASACASAGIGLLLLMLVLRLGWPGGTNHVADVAIVIFITTIPFTVVVVMFRRKLTRFSKQSQWLLAWISIGILIIATAMFVANIR